MSLRKYSPYFIVACCSLLYLYPFMRSFSGSEDQGILMNGAVRVTEGQVPFRDFFEVIGPGSFYWLAMFFNLFGTNWLATRISLMFTTVVVILLVYFLSRCHSTFDAIPAIFLLAVSTPLLSSISYHVDSNLFALFSFATLLAWLESRHPILIFMTGALAGITTCFLQPKGLLLLLSSLLAMWLLCRKEPAFLLSIARLVAGYLMVGSCTLVLFWKAGGLPELLYANVVFPLTNYNHVGVVPYGLGLGMMYWNPWATALRGAFSPMLSLCVSSLLMVPPLVLLALPLLLTFFGIRYRSLAFTRDTAPYWIVGFALWFSEIYRKDMAHLVYGSPILIILCFRLYHQLPHRFYRQTLKFVAISGIVLAGFNGLVAFAQLTETVTRRGTIYTSGDHDAVLDFLNTHTTRGEQIFVYPYRPMYYFLSDARNPTRFSYMMYQFNTQSQFCDAVQSLEQSKVRYVIWDRKSAAEKFKTWFPAYRQPREEDLIMEPYLAGHYTLLENVKGFRILERRSNAIKQAGRTCPAIGLATASSAIPRENTIEAASLTARGIGVGQ